MTDSSIPKEVDTPEIAKQGEDSNNTQPQVEGTTINNQEQPKDSNGQVENVQTDTPKADSDVEDAKREYANLARIQYETMKSDISKDPDRLTEIVKHDKKLANKLVKSLYGNEGYNDGKGFTNYDELITYAETKQKVSAIEDPNVKTVVEENMQLKQRIDDIEQSSAERDQQEYLDWLYKKYPNLSKAQDPNDENFKKFREELDPLLRGGVNKHEAAKKAYRLAFGDIDEDETRELTKSLGSLPSGGSATQLNSDKIKISPDSRRVEERTGVAAQTVEKYGNYFD